MPDAAAPSSEAQPTKPSNRSEKSSKHSSRDKERSSRDEHRVRSGKEHKEHKHKHKSKGKDRDREKRSNGDREQKQANQAKDDSRERDRHRSSRQEEAAPSGRADAEPGELAPDAPPQRGSPADREAADGARAEADEFLRGEEAHTALPPPPQSLPPPPRPLPPPPAPQAAAGPSDAEVGLPPLAGDVAPGGSEALPAAFMPQTSEAGGEVSMSIEETNRCRALANPSEVVAQPGCGHAPQSHAQDHVGHPIRCSQLPAVLQRSRARALCCCRMRVAMGLKPLKVGGGPSATEAREAKEVAAGKKRVADREREASAKAHRERIAQ